MPDDDADPTDFDDPVREQLAQIRSLLRKLLDKQGGPPWPPP